MLGCFFTFASTFPSVHHDPNEIDQRLVPAYHLPDFAKSWVTVGDDRHSCPLDHVTDRRLYAAHTTTVQGFRASPGPPFWKQMIGSAAQRGPRILYMSVMAYRNASAFALDLEYIDR